MNLNYKLVGWLIWIIGLISICVPQVSEYMRQRIKQSELKVFDCGHLPFLDKPEEFNSTIDNFIKKLK